MADKYGEWGLWHGFRSKVFKDLLHCVIFSK